MRLFSNPQFLAIYSGLLTVAFILTVSLGLERGDFSLRHGQPPSSVTRDSRISISLLCIVSTSLNRTVLRG